MALLFRPVAGTTLVMVKSNSHIERVKTDVWNLWRGRPRTR